MFLKRNKVALCSSNRVSPSYISGTWDGCIVFSSVWVYCKVATQLLALSAERAQGITEKMFLTPCLVI